MKEYNKEKLHEYAKELFALCDIKHIKYSNLIFTDQTEIRIGKEFIKTFICKDKFNKKSTKKDNLIMPIWELIEKVKQL